VSPNRLAAETSPYLRQHADNPVDWYPWGEEAFERARREDKPVLLSVGYSACHWCHVMAHESFENPATAMVMNERFVNIKVDREERPDVDAVYMDAVQAMAGQGGWPMTVFLTPDGEPFFGGTYFPPRRSHGRPAFVEVMEAIIDAWRNRRSEVLEQATELIAAIREQTALTPDAGASVSADLLQGGYQALRSVHDPEWGGFGQAPKFPQPSFCELMLRAWSHNRSDDTLAVVRRTLDAMAAGGIYDHLGGGFARYSTDRTWTAPHFEKMLYDQAGLVSLYTHASSVLPDAPYAQVLRETIEYVVRDLRAPEGGLYSAEDADSEGVEGKFYVWTPDEIRTAVGDELAAVAIDWYGVTDAGNFEGNNILRRPVGAPLARPPEVEEARGLLFAAREQRIRPGLDDKVLTEWNAMFVSALAEAAARFGDMGWDGVAVEIAEFLLTSLRRGDGRWLRAWQREAGAKHLAYAVDYAWLVDAFTRLSELTGEARWMAEARKVADAMLDLFWDDTHGGLFTTGHDAEQLLIRQKDTYDGATPSANSVAAVALLRLAALTGESRYDEHAQAILRLLADSMRSRPAAHTYALAGVDLVSTGVTEVAVLDRPDLLEAARGGYRPNIVLAHGEPYDSPLWHGRRPGFAYVCRDFACQRPASDAQTLLAQLGATAGPPAV